MPEAMNDEPLSAKSATPDRLAGVVRRLQDLGTVQIKATVAVALRLLGLEYREIATVMALSLSAVEEIMAHADVRGAVKEFRRVAKWEFVERALASQRKFFQAIEDMPGDKEHAGAHARYATALGVIAEKGALMAGEATARTESRSVHIALTLEEKEALVRDLEATRTLERERTALAPGKGEHDVG